MKPPDPIAISLSSLLAELPSPKSKRAYTDDWDRFRAWVEGEGTPILTSRPRHVVAYVAKLREEGKARASTGRALSVIRAVFGVLVRDELMESNPAREVKNPKVSTEPKTPWLKQEQVALLFDGPRETWTDRRDTLCLMLLFGLGFRRSEVARMRVEDFRDGAVAAIVKGGKLLTVGVAPWLLGEIEAWKEHAGIEQGALLPRSQSRANIEHMHPDPCALETCNPSAISGDIIYQIVKKAEKRAGLPKGSIAPHGLRRSNATITGERGRSLKEIQLSLGHVSSSTTERYQKSNNAAANAPGAVLEDLVRGK